MENCDNRDVGRAGVKYSVVVPFYNEAAAAEKLHGRITRAMERIGEPYEAIYVNDGSRDNTAEILAEIAQDDCHVTFIDMRRNFGQTAALQAGIDHAVGQVVIAMDGDGQHDPFEIPLFVKRIDEGYDIASGWRVRRADSFFVRRLPSRIANWLLALASGVKLHDFGTTFKAYRREVLQAVRLYGDMHRFIPAVCARLGAKICEVPIKNVRRRGGRSSYGLLRTFGVALDIMALRFTTKYMHQPLHLFGKWAMVCGVTGSAILGYGLVRKLLAWGSFQLFQEHAPLMALGFLLEVAAMLFLATGLMGEFLMRIYFESSGTKTYAIRRIVRGREATHDDGGG